MHNLQNLLNKDDLQATGTISTFFSSQGRVFVLRVSRRGTYLEPKVRSLFSATICSMQEIKKINTNGLLTRTKFQWFLSKAPRSTFKKLIISTPLLLQGLHMMSLAKSVPDGLKPQECERSCLHEPPPVPYVPVKDEVQEEVSKMRNLQIKTSLK